MINLQDVSIPSSSCIWLFIIFLYTVSHNSQPSLCDTENMHLTCVAPFHCGDTSLNLSYPFWGSTRPNYCGHPIFELNCTGKDPVLSIMSITYKVIEVNYYSQSLRLARLDYWNDICPVLNPINSALDSTFFNYTDDTASLILFYSCPTGTSTVSGLKNVFSCPNQSNDSVNYYELKPTTNSLSRDGFWSCKMSVILPIIQSAARRIGNDSTVVNLVSALRAGFGLQWRLNNATCHTCEVSGGACGSNPSTGEFICYCNTGSYSSACLKAPPPKSTLWIRLVIGLLVGLAVIITTVIFVYYYIKKTMTSKQVEEVIRAYDSQIPKRYSYAEVKKMTIFIQK